MPHFPLKLKEGEKKKKTWYTTERIYVTIMLEKWLEIFEMIP